MSAVLDGRVGEEGSFDDLSRHQVVSVEGASEVVLEDLVRDATRGGGVRVPIAVVEADLNVRRLGKARSVVDVRRDVRREDDLRPVLGVAESLELGLELLKERALLIRLDDAGLVLICRLVVELATSEVQVETVEAHAVGAGLRPVH